LEWTTSRAQHVLDEALADIRAVEHPLNRRVIGFDVNQQRLSDLQESQDRTNKTSPEEQQAATGLEFTTNAAHLAAADVFIVTDPTPIDRAPNALISRRWNGPVPP